VRPPPPSAGRPSGNSRRPAARSCPPRHPARRRRSVRHPPSRRRSPRLPAR